MRLRETNDDRGVSGRAASDTTVTDRIHASAVKDAERAERAADRAEAKADRAETRAETRPDTTPTTDSPERAGVRTAPPAPAGPRPRASLLATLSLITGVAAALLVLTGTLAGYGVGLGALALVLAIAGISATGRRHVAGKTDALIGLVLGLGAVVLGVFVLTDSVSWLTMDTPAVTNLREWLDTRFNSIF
ncbi:hypothetical protein [Spirilliplanes yamanashiensis]|uniref:Thrombospondin n=1 Tax=Spirilliplanes yamanashiensis TaxID=42233 RepID=A0A8J3Y3Q9_9ACTN|nr:hypothetical protein [Spirilliplanes yamanashiensis]MDP9820051.1 hypothetical protein [Spirilliplanes yamanashiensis]GIJ01128.1 hypothetical protein Sya03_04800 [Spirilliplanes yamanashiensis]